MKSLPLELLLLILENVDSPRTLAAASCTCCTLQFEAERLLYREVDVERVRHVRSLHQALTTSSRRAPLVNALRIRMTGGLSPVFPLVNDILLFLTKLAHLEIKRYGYFGKSYETVMRTLAKCTFRLKSLESWAVKDSDFDHFLRQQTGLQSLRIVESDSPDWGIPQDALPHLKYVQTFQTFFVQHIRGPHAITHLDLFMNGSDQMCTETFRAVRHQLVSLKYRRHPRRAVWPLISDIIDSRLIPNLRYLEIQDISDSGASFRPCSRGSLMHMGGPAIALDTLVYSAVYFTRVKDVPLTERGRLACVRPWAKELLQTNSNLRRFFFVDRDRRIQETCVMLFTLSSDDKLLEERNEESDLPVWSDT